MTKRVLFLSVFSLMAGITAWAQNSLTISEMKSMTTLSNGSTVSIHDPSVVYRNGTYYIWGSHLGVASSKDLVTFTGLSANNQTFAHPDGTRCDFNTAFNQQAVTKVKNFNGEIVDFPQVDAEAWCSWYAENKETWVSGNMWAPDLIWNESMRKWCMYLSLNGDRWASIVVLLTAATPTGPFTYQGPVVMGGFNGESAAPNYKNTDMEIALGAQSSLPARYNQKGNWGTYWPNCIDPCAFYDEEGELWLIYGSWSGGIFMLKLDKETGLRDYTYTYTSDYETSGANGVSDPYFGKKIAGGYYVSGEGPYIQHIGEYYYLFMSYGGFAPGGYDNDGKPQGGYEMRIFRSKNPDGPYVDASGASATYTGYQLNYGAGANTNRGLKLMDAYNGWGLQEVGERSQGHNSACQDGNGRTFVVYHTKFNNGTAGHQVRVHQLFLNEKDWLVSAPFCYAGETTTDEDIANTPISVDEIVGTYHFLLHPYRQDYAIFEEQEPTELTLTADGKVKGAYTGTWTIKEGTSYLTLKLGTSTYYGVFVEQSLNGATKQNFKTSQMKALTFTAVGTSGVPVWGYKLKPEYAVSWNYVNNTIPVKTGSTYANNLSLIFPTIDNTVLTWTSSEPDVISETGKYSPRESVVPVTLTVRLECQDVYWEQSYNVKAQKEVIPGGDYLGGLVAYYDMDAYPCYNAYNTAERITFGTTGTKPVLTSDYDRMGQVLHQSFGAQKSNSSTRMPNPLLNKTNVTGTTISMWVRRTDDNMWDAIWGFFNSTSASASGPRFFLTGNAYLGYNNNDGIYFDVNYPGETAYTDIPVGKWTLVTVTVGETNGVRLYINGINKTAHTVVSSSGATKVTDLPYSSLIGNLTGMKYFYLGLGSFWGSADCYIDDVMIYNRELSATDVRALNTMENRVSDFTIGEGGTGILPVATQSQHTERGFFDLQGRRVAKPTRGLYIVNGKKVLIK